MANINPPLLRKVTSMEETGGMGSKRSKEKLSRQEIIKSLKCLDGVRTREDSTIYGCMDNEFASPLIKGLRDN